MPRELDDLIALNQEMAALARAGLPLEQALIGVSGGLPKNLRAITKTIAAHLTNGHSLADSLELESNRLPKVYRAVVEAGVRSGRLPAALEKLTSFLSAYVDFRRAIGEALWYPIVVLLIAYFLFVGLVIGLLPRLADAVAILSLDQWPALDTIKSWGDTVWIWGPIPPSLVAIGVLLWWLAGRSGAFRSAPLAAIQNALPGIRDVHRHAETAFFADWLALLLDHDQPLPVALRLAADATNRPPLRAAAEWCADAIEQGIGPIEIRDDPRAAAIPATIRFALFSNQSAPNTPRAIGRIAAHESTRAARAAQRVKTSFPLVMLVYVAGVAVLAYSLVLFLPWSALLKNLGKFE